MFSQVVDKVLCRLTYIQGEFRGQEAAAEHRFDETMTAQKSLELHFLFSSFCAVHVHVHMVQGLSSKEK